MSFGSEVEQVGWRLVHLLDNEGIPYFVMGGLAVPIWGVPRATYDVDFTVHVDEERLRRLLDRAAAAGFEVAPPFLKGFRDVLKGMEKLTLAWWTGEGRRIDADVFLVTTPYQRAAFDRRRRAELGPGQTLWVIAPADLIIHKLLAGRAKDMADVQNVLAIQGVSDPEYLRRWACELGVEARLDQALTEAGLSG